MDWKQSLNCCMMGINFHLLISPVLISLDAASLKKEGLVEKVSFNVKCQSKLCPPRPLQGRPSFWIHIVTFLCIKHTATVQYDVIWFVLLLQTGAVS